jgi:hypothetical protein
VIGGGANGLDCLRLAGDLIPILLPEMLHLGVATAAEIGVETLAERMINEAISNESDASKSAHGVGCDLPNACARRANDFRRSVSKRASSRECFEPPP